jgi:hypothetical protein
VLIKIRILPKKWDYSSWYAELVRSDLPKNIIIGISLSYRHNKLDTFPSFLQKIDGIINQVLSVPWLSKYISDNLTTEFKIRFVPDHSLSVKGKENFLDDLKKFGTNSLEDSIMKMLDDSVFVEVKEKLGPWSRWLILPDRRMVLWQIKGASVLKWKPADFKTITIHETKDWFAAKALIAPDGNVESR